MTVQTQTDRAECRCSSDKIDRGLRAQLRRTDTESYKDKTCLHGHVQEVTLASEVGRIHGHRQLASRVVISKHSLTIGKSDMLSTECVKGGLTLTQSPARHVFPGQMQ